MSDPIRVIFADDSVTIRRFLEEAFRRAVDLEVVGIAKNGREAIGLVRAHRPDILLLDVEMPVMDGIDTVRALRQFNAELPVVMFSSLTKSGGEATLDALAAGANGYAQKPGSGTGPEDALRHIEQNLVPQIRQLAKAKADANHPPLAQVRPTAVSKAATDEKNVQTQIKVTNTCATGIAGSSPTAVKRTFEPCGIVVIGASTGGPNALAELLPLISSRIKVPILIAQHMPTVFTKLLADRLNGLTKLEVREAKNGETPKAGTVLIAPGDYHLEIEAAGAMPKVCLHQGPEENSCRPAVDVLFRSAALAYRDKALGIVLTGMGKDGTEGCRYLHQKGSRIITQDQATCVIWGMPRSVVEAGLSDEVLPLKKIAAAINKYAPVAPQATLVAQ